MSSILLDFVDCFVGNGADYYGEIAVTMSGRTCQRWDVQLPNDHAYSDYGTHNFCRNFLDSDKSISELLGVSMGKEPPRDGNSAISLDTDPKNHWYLRCLSMDRLAQYAATDLWITTTAPLKYAVFWVISTEVSCEAQTRDTRRMQFRWGVAWKGRGSKTALEVLMPGATLGLGMDIAGPEMLSASKLSATRIIVESERNSPASASCDSPRFSTFVLQIHYDMDCVFSCLQV